MKSVAMLQPRPTASCLYGGNEVGYPADNEEPRRKICRHGTRPREPTQPPPSQDLQRHSSKGCFPVIRLFLRTFTYVCSIHDNERVYACSEHSVRITYLKKNASLENSLKAGFPLGDFFIKRSTTYTELTVTFWFKQYLIEIEISNCPPKTHLKTVHEKLGTLSKLGRRRR